MQAHRVSLALAALISHVGAGSPAWAEEGQKPASEQGATVETVTVTAQRRSENLQDVPLSATVIDELARIAGNITSLDALTQQTPSVSVQAGSRAASLYIRGIGSGENQAFDQSVGLFIDDIYHGRSRTSSAVLFDLDRVEILKGPQSTFFGNNAIAGALSIATRRPGRAFDANARAVYGEAGQYTFEGAAGGPLSETISLRGAATFNGSDGWLENVNTGEDQPRQRNMAGRLTALYQPSEDFDATFKIEGSRQRNSSGLFLQLVNCPPPAPFVASNFCSLALAQGLPTGLDNERNAQSPGQRMEMSAGETVLTLNWQRANHTLTSVSGAHLYDYELNLDTDGIPASLLNVRAPERHHQFSQELRLISEAGRPVEYMAGLYFQTDELRFDQNLSFFFLNPVIAGVPAFAPLVPYLPVGQLLRYRQDEKSYAAFGAATWNITDHWKLSGGLRASRVDKDFDWQLQFGTATQDYGGIVPLPAPVATLPNFIPGLGTAGILSGSRGDDAWLPSIKIQYEPMPALMLYTSYARGFKAGGFNGPTTTANARDMPYAPEYVDAYEAGMKSEWLDDRLLVNMAVFHSDYRDLQVAQNLPNSGGTFVSVVRNAAQSRSRGVELETQWVATRNFKLSLAATYLDARYTDYQHVAPTVLQQRLGQSEQDLSGAPTSYAPKWSGTLTGTYGFDLPSGRRLSAEFSTFASTSYFIGGGNNDPTQEQHGYARLDGRLTLESDSRRWAFDLIGKNLTDRTVIVYAANQPLSLGSGLQQKQQPRYFLLQVRYQH